MFIETAVETKLYYKERFQGGGIHQDFSGPTPPQKKKNKSKMKLKQSKTPTLWLFIKSGTLAKISETRHNPLTWHNKCEMPHNKSTNILKVMKTQDSRTICICPIKK